MPLLVILIAVLVAGGYAAFSRFLGHRERMAELEARRPHVLLQLPPGDPGRLVAHGPRAHPQNRQRDQLHRVGRGDEQLRAGLEGEINGITGRIETQYAAKQDDYAAFETPTDSYLTVNARLGFEIAEGVKLSLEGRNLTDEEVRLHASPLKDIAPMTGRNFRVAIRAEF